MPSPEPQYSLAPEHLEALLAEIRRNPSHPGCFLLDTINGLDLSLPQAAQRLAIDLHDLARVTECHAPITPDLALRLETAGWSSAAFWLRLQTKYDLAQERLNRPASHSPAQTAAAAALPPG